MCSNLRLLCALCRVGIYSACRRMCCLGPPPVKPEFTILCLGLNGSGKSTLIAVLTKEELDYIEPTIGFIIKPLTFKDCVLNIKEVGGGDTVRPYWDRYFISVQGVIFVVDSSATDDNIALVKTELHKAFDHENLVDMPLMVFANQQDKEAARNVDCLTEMLELETLKKNHWIIHPCSANNEESIRQGFLKLNKILLREGDKEEN